MSNPALSYPLHRPNRLAPPEFYATLRTERRVADVAMGDGGMASLLTRYSDIRAALGDRRFSMFPPGFDPAANSAMSNPFQMGKVRSAFARFVTRGTWTPCAPDRKNWSRSFSKKWRPRAAPPIW